MVPVVTLAEIPDLLSHRKSGNLISRGTLYLFVSCIYKGGKKRGRFPRPRILIRKGER